MMSTQTHDQKNVPVRCEECGGVGVVQHPLMPSKTKGCYPCMGAGWHWSDGVPPTMCPGGGRAPIVAEPVRPLPCGRSGRTCPGCDRATGDIGGDEDKRRTMLVPPVEADPHVLKGSHS